MSFSNANTGNQAGDPYTAKNIEDPSLREKVEDLVHFVDKCKFCMMTTKTSDNMLVSRCMALAAKVSHIRVRPSGRNSFKREYIIVVHAAVTVKLIFPHKKRRVDNRALLWNS